MKINISRLLRLLTCLLLVLAMAVPDPAMARRRKSRSKAKTTQTVSRKKSSKKSRRSKTRRNYNSRKSTAPAYAEAAASEREELAEKIPAKSTRRKIKVEKPDLQKIKEQTLDPASPMYFPKLLAKYNLNDTTMTSEEYRNFYLGYMFQEDYDPYRTSMYSGVTDHLRMKATHTKEERDTIMKYAELSLKDNPFDLRQMSFLVHVLKEKRKDMSAKIWEYRLEHLLGAIKSTGTGEDIENAWYVISPMHEYDIVQLLGYEATDAEFFEPGVDYLTVVADENTLKRMRGKEAKGFYFNVETIQEQYEMKHPDEVEAGEAEAAGGSPEAGEPETVAEEAEE